MDVMQDKLPPFPNTHVPVSVWAEAQVKLKVSVSLQVMPRYPVLGAFFTGYRFILNYHTHIQSQRTTFVFACALPSLPHFVSCSLPVE